MPCQPPLLPLLSAFLCSPPPPPPALPLKASKPQSRPAPRSCSCPTSAGPCIIPVAGTRGSPGLRGGWGRWPQHPARPGWQWPCPLGVPTPPAAEHPGRPAGLDVRWGGQERRGWLPVSLHSSSWSRTVASSFREPPHVRAAVGTHRGGCQLWGRRSDRSRGTARCRCQASPSWLLPAQGCREGTSPPCLECQPGPGGLGWGVGSLSSVYSLGELRQPHNPGHDPAPPHPQGPRAPPPPSLTGAPVTAGSSPLAAPSGPPAPLPASALTGRCSNTTR